MMGPGDTPGRHDGKPADPKTQTADYLKLNPQGLIPSLVVRAPGGDIVALSESNAIVRYVARRFGLHDGQGPASEGEVASEVQAVQEAWMDRQAGFWGVPNMLPVVQLINETSRKKAEDRSPENLKKTLCDFAEHEHTKLLDSQLTSTDFLAGNSFSMADIPFGCIACRFYVAKEVSEQMGLWAQAGEAERMAATPALDAWFARLLARDAFRHGAYDLERMHSGLPPTRSLPEWHLEYLRANNLVVPPRSR